MLLLITIFLGSILIIGSVILLIYSFRTRKEALSYLQKCQQKFENSKREIEQEKKEALIRLKDELHKKRLEFDVEIRREKSEIERLQLKINSRAEAIDKKDLTLEELRKELLQKERQLSRTLDQQRTNEQKIKQLYDDLINKLSAVSSMTKEEAQKNLLTTLEDEVRLSNQKYIQKVEDEARQFAKEKAINIVVNAMQRYTADQVAHHSSGIVHLPNEEMKGRIIGKEGRNIKALEVATGMEFVIGETPEVIMISGFNPIRREIAKRSLEKLILDGRINPTRIEETIQQCEREIEDIIQEYGKNAILELNLQGVKQEIISSLGKLHFRTSFSQNVLVHSMEVALFSRIIAQELGLPNPDIALRSGLFHDIGKAVSAEVEGSHALIGAEIAKRCGEDPFVVNAIAAHHEEEAFISPYSPIVVIADMVSASRPGARRETLSTYIKRLEKLEEICNGFTGVKKAYALQAGREVRVIVEEDQLNDDNASLLAREIAGKIEADMSFPGQIKVNVIREKRSVEFAK